MKLSQLIAVDYDVEITGIAVDSRKVQKGNLFLCVRGERADGHDYVYEALKKGAAVIVAERSLGLENEIVLPDTRRAAASLYATWYRNPQKELRIFGVTGTNGKSTTVALLQSIYQQAGYKTAVCGTLGCSWEGKQYSLENTTPLPEVLYERLREMADDGVTHLFMEVSSHSLALERVSEIDFCYGVFTNLTPEHLDFHKTMEEYALAKEKLFLQSEQCVINLDDAYGNLAYQKYSSRSIGYGKAARADCRLNEILHQGLNGSIFTIRYQKQDYLLTTALAGEYNLYNVLSAVSVALSDGVAMETISTAVASFSGIKGRLEPVYQGEFMVFIDYAHTPDALLRVLTDLRKASPKRLRVLFGCGGDRDRSKRHLMGRIAQTVADDVIVTSDNSRSEDPCKIIDDILAGLENIPCDEVAVIPNRKEALCFAIQTARAGDVLLVAGKGHEEYEIDRLGRHPFSESEIISDMLKRYHKTVDERK